MGYSMTAEAYAKLQKLNAEGRRCKLNSCSRRATWAFTMRAVTVDAAGTVLLSVSGNAPYTQGFCGTCGKSMARTFEVHGKVDAEGHLTYFVETGEGKAGQYVSLIEKRQLSRTETLPA